MENKNLMIIAFVILLAILLIFLVYFTINPNLFNSVSAEKCTEINTDDCWHSLAHQTLNNTYCNKIQDNETKEHCFEHIPS